MYLLSLSHRRLLKFSDNYNKEILLLQRVAAKMNGMYLNKVFAVLAQNKIYYPVDVLEIVTEMRIKESTRLKEYQSKFVNLVAHAKCTLCRIMPTLYVSFVS